MWYVECGYAHIPSSFSKSTGNSDDPELGSTNDNSAPTSVTCNKVHTSKTLNMFTSLSHTKSFKACIVEKLLEHAAFHSLINYVD